jgi:hypothetical protein
MEWWKKEEGEQRWEDFQRVAARRARWGFAGSRCKPRGGRSDTYSVNNKPALSSLEQAPQFFELLANSLTLWLMDWLGK